MPLNQLYQILKEESNSKVTLDEVKTLVKHVRDKSGTAQRVGSSEDVDINDLINAIMDIDGAAKHKRYNPHSQQPQINPDDEEKVDRLQGMVFDL